MPAASAAVAPKPAKLEDSKRTSSSRSSAIHSKDFWMPDEVAQRCYECDTAFSTFFRRHHCRMCGQIFCKNCTSFIEGVRLCSYCRDLTLTRRQSNDAQTGQANVDLIASSAVFAVMQEGRMAAAAAARRLDDDGITGDGDDTPSRRTSTAHEDVPTSSSRKLFNAFRRRPTFSSASAAATADADGTDDEDDAISRTSSSSRASTAGIFANTGSGSFRSGPFLRNSPSASGHNSDDEGGGGDGDDGLGPPSASSVDGARHAPPTTVSFYRTQRQHSVYAAATLAALSSPSANSLKDSAQSSGGAGRGDDAAQRLRRMAHDKAYVAVREALREAELPAIWAQHVIALAVNAVDHLDVDIVQGGRMSVLHYAKIKCVPSGEPSQSRVVDGVVFAKNVVSKRMRTRVQQPRILLIGCAIDFGRTTLRGVETGGAHRHKLSSLDTLLPQEHKHMELVVNRIASLEPDVVLCEQRVARLAQDMLLAKNITLVTHVKPHVMERVAYCTDTMILNNLNGDLISTSRCGTAERFHVHGYKRDYLTADGVEDEGDDNDADADGEENGDGEANGDTDEAATAATNESVVVASPPSMLRLGSSRRGSRMPIAPDEEIDDDVFLRDKHDKGPVQSHLPSGRATFLIEKRKTQDTFVFLEKPQRAGYGCTVMLFGAPLAELTQVKRILQRTLSIVYHMHLETKFMLDCDIVDKCSIPRPLIGERKDDDSSSSSSESDNSSSSDADSDSESESSSVESTAVDVRATALTAKFSLSTTSVCSVVLELDDMRKSSRSRHAHDRRAYVAPSVDDLSLLVQLRDVGGEPLAAFAFLQRALSSRSALPSSAEVASGEAAIAFAGLVDRTPPPPPLFLHRYKFYPANRPASWHMFPNLFTSNNANNIRASPRTLHPCGVRFDYGELLTLQRDGFAVPLTGPVQPHRVTSPNQTLIYQHLLFNARAARQCVPAELHTIDFYSENDLSLGQFLEWICFNPNFVCRIHDCDADMTAHERSFFHGHHRLNVAVREQTTVLPVDQLLTWTTCKQCRHTSSAKLLSDDAWKLSFGKFLEAAFHGVDVLRCSDAECRHSASGEHVRYFGFRQYVAVFELQPVAVASVALPAVLMAAAPEAARAYADEGAQDLSAKAQAAFALIVTELQSHQVAAAEWNASESLKRVAALLDAYNTDKQRTHAYIDRLFAERNLNSLDVYRVRKSVVSLVRKWNTLLADLARVVRADVKQQRTIAAAAAAQQQKAPTATVSDSGVGASASALTGAAGAGSNKLLAAPATGPNRRRLENSIRTRSGSLLGPPQHVVASDSGDESPATLSGSGGVDVEGTVNVGIPVDRSTGTMSPALMHSGGVDDGDAPAPQPTTAPAAAASTTRAKPMKKSTHMDFFEHDIVLPSGVGGIDIPVNLERPHSIVAYTLASVEYWRELNATSAGTSGTSAASGDGGETVAQPQQATSSLASTVASAADDHEPPITVSPPPRSDDDATAATTAAVDPESDVAKAHGALDEHVKVLTAAQMMEPLSTRVHADALDPPMNQTECVQALISPERSDVRVTLTSAERKGLKMTCQVWFAKHFAALRRLVLKDDRTESSFVQALASCSEWQPRGGKKASSWQRTADGRFVLKVVEKREREEMVKLAPAYFRYMLASSLRACEQASLLSKIFGVYTVEVTGPFRKTSADIVVVENVFRGRNVASVYDLKGSVRSRYVDPESEGAVMQDENLLEIMFASPFCVDRAAKARLALAIFNDAKFLSSHQLLDYSLLVGFDKSRGELVVGIVDFLTSWNYARDLEYRLKKSGVLGQRGKVPTIVPPMGYAARFRDALWQYFMLVPDKFTPLCVTNVTESGEIESLLEGEPKDE